MKFLVPQRGVEPLKTCGLNAVAVPICICHQGINWQARWGLNPGFSNYEFGILPTKLQAYNLLQRKKIYIAPQLGIEPSQSLLNRQVHAPCSDFAEQYKLNMYSNAISTLGGFSYILILCLSLKIIDFIKNFYVA